MQHGASFVPGRSSFVLLHFRLVLIENKELRGRSPLQSEAGPFFSVESASHLDFIMKDGSPKTGGSKPRKLAQEIDLAIFKKIRKSGDRLRSGVPAVTLRSVTTFG